MVVIVFARRYNANRKAFLACRKSFSGLDGKGVPAKLDTRKDSAAGMQSPRLETLIHLRICYSAKMHHLKSNYEFEYKCKNDFDFDAFDFDAAFGSLIKKKESEFSVLVNKADQNTSLWIQYKRELEKLPDFAFRGSSQLAHEKEVCASSYLPEPVMTFSISLRAISPHGGYARCQYYGLDKVKAQLRDIRDGRAADSAKRFSSQNERSKMTPKLRYEVMKRDGFRCAICGVSSCDGAVLEVDHILPVSKGGKTVESNLQTLCRECNRGKGVDCADDA